MDDQTSLLEQGFENLRLDLLDTLGGANVHLQPETIPRSLRARVRAKLKVLEAILRRLILLLAMTLDLAPVRPRAPRDAAAVPKGVPEGVEDVTASFRAHLPPQYRMALIGRPLGPPGDFDALKAARLSGPVLAMPLLRHAAVLLQVIKQPDGAARRMARLIERMKRRGETKPYCLPLAGRTRLGPELALISGAVRLQVNAALADWPDNVPDTS